MFCSKCGSTNKDDATYCWNCGNPIQVGQPTVYPQGSSEQVVQPPVPKPVQYAGFWRRFLALIIDGVILWIPRSLIGLFFGLSMFSILGSSEHIPDLTSIFALIASAFWSGVLSFLLDWLYHAGFECSSFQATPGKMAISVIVTDMEGKRISFGRATGRHFGKIISGLILCVGFMMAGWTQKKQALHDMLADCLVVKK